MAHSTKGTHRIDVRETVYRWRAIGADYSITLVIWPSHNDTHEIRCGFGYHESHTDADGVAKSVPQLIVTNRLVRRVLEYTLDNLEYDPNTAAEDLLIKDVETLIDWSDAVRATR